MYAAEPLLNRQVKETVIPEFTRCAGKKRRMVCTSNIARSGTFDRVSTELLRVSFTVCPIMKDNTLCMVLLLMIERLLNSY